MTEAVPVKQSRLASATTRALQRTFCTCAIMPLPRWPRVTTMHICP